MKLTLYTTTVFVCFAVFASAQEIVVPFQQFNLPNGLHVILHQDNTIPRISINVWYHVGSGSERPGRTGFAHLFEHILFEGSQHVPEGKFDQWLEAAGGDNNGSTTEDRTNYYEDLPSNALDLALFLESDRMGHLLPSLSEKSVNGQRDVVKNERRQSFENQPYGKAYLEVPALLYPTNHPYSWPVIGSMDDLSASSYQDVVDFFSTYYTPGNASLCIAGDINYEEAKKSVAYWFSDVKAGKPVPPINAPAANLLQEKRVVFEDDVQLPQLMMIWLTPPNYAPGNAEVDLIGRLLANGKNSRLYKRLVYDLQIAQSVTASQHSSKLASEFYITVTARQGVTLTQIETVIQEEIDKLKKESPQLRELQRAVNQTESSFLEEVEQVGGFNGKANQLNNYYFYTGKPDYFNENLRLYKAVGVADISANALKYLKDDARVVMSIVPMGKKELAAIKK